MERKERGQEAEQIALDYLQQQGLTLKDLNYRCKQGEIDLIMMHAHAVVFVEVRYRKSDMYGSAAETVDIRKQRRLVLAAQHYLNRHYAREQNCRFDIIGISGPLRQTSIQWIRNAFTLTG